MVWQGLFWIEELECNCKTISWAFAAWVYWTGPVLTTIFYVHRQALQASFPLLKDYECSICSTTKRFDAPSASKDESVFHCFVWKAKGLAITFTKSLLYIYRSVRYLTFKLSLSCICDYPATSFPKLYFQFTLLKPVSTTSGILDVSLPLCSHALHQRGLVPESRACYTGRAFKREGSSGLLQTWCQAPGSENNLKRFKTMLFLMFWIPHILLHNPQFLGKLWIVKQIAAKIKERNTPNFMIVVFTLVWGRFVVTIK